MGLLLNELAFSCQLHLALPPVCTSQILYPEAIVNPQRACVRGLQ